MFKKGGLSQETGIMSGLDSPRRRYAQGSYAPRVGYAEGTNFFQKIYDVLNPSEETIVNRLQEKQKNLNEPFIKTNTYKEQQQKIKEELDKNKKPLVAGPFDYLQPKTESTVTSTGAGEGQSDLENLQDYMKMFEAAAAGDPDEARKSRYLELAKFGSNILAQPGGDLTGAIGKAASSSIGGLSKQMAADRAAKQSGKIMGLKAGLDQMDMGEFGKKIKSLAKFSGQSVESVAKKFLSGEDDFDKEYLAAAEASGVEPGASRKIYLENIKAMFKKNPDVAAKLNKPFPKKNAVPGEYYVLPGGQFTRWVDGEKVKPTEPGFFGDIDQEV